MVSLVKRLPFLEGSLGSTVIVVRISEVCLLSTIPLQVKSSKKKSRSEFSSEKNFFQEQQNKRNVSPFA